MKPKRFQNPLVSPLFGMVMLLASCGSGDVESEQVETSPRPETRETIHSEILEQERRAQDAYDEVGRVLRGL